MGVLLSENKFIGGKVVIFVFVARRVVRILEQSISHFEVRRGRRIVAQERLVLEVVLDERVEFTSLSHTFGSFQIPRDDLFVHG